MCELPPLAYSQPAAVAQGDWLGNAGNTGYVLPQPQSRCGASPMASAHVHFIPLHNGVTENITMSEVTVQHLSDEPNSPHYSNNSGPGYLGAFPPTPSEFVSTVNPVRQRFLAVTQFPELPNSTYTTTFATCNNTSLYLHGCALPGGTTVLNQHLISSRVVGGNLRLPSSLAFNPVQSSVVHIKGAIWKGYGTRAGGLETYARVGKPISDEILVTGGAQQTFEFGLIRKTSLFTAIYTVEVFDLAGVRIAGPFAYKDVLTSRECNDIDGDGAISILDLTQIANRFTKVEGDGMYDPLYDIDQDRAISILDLTFVAGQFGMCCPPE